jgi:Protein of unknown function (DUF1353)
MSFGKFSGEPDTEWLDDGRNMRLLQELSYLDPAGKKWVALKGFVTDGASIPKPLWSFIGGPFEGEYRNAAIVHDSACALRLETWQHSHLMFFNACRCGGVGELEAKVLFAGVWEFGPRWTIDQRMASEGMPREMTNADFANLKSYIRVRNPSLDGIMLYPSSSPSPVRELP